MSASRPIVAKRILGDTKLWVESLLSLFLLLLVVLLLPIIIRHTIIIIIIIITY